MFNGVVLTNVEVPRPEDTALDVVGAWLAVCGDNEAQEAMPTQENSTTKYCRLGLPVAELKLGDISRDPLRRAAAALNACPEPGLRCGR